MKHLIYKGLIGLVVLGLVALSFLIWPVPKTEKIAEQPKLGSQTDTYTSTDTWTAPAGVTTVQVECWGAGGTGGTGNVTKGGGGGGGGAYAKTNSISVTPSQGYTVTVGQNAGEDSGFDDNSQILAEGGDNASGFSGAAGGDTDNSIGDVVYKGGNGGNGNCTGGGGSGGGGAGDGEAGGNGSNCSTGVYPAGGTGGSASGGEGGGGSEADPGSTLSGGGAGGQSGGGGAGARGECRITYTAGAADPCLYSGSGDFEIYSSNNCYIATDTYVAGDCNIYNDDPTGALNIIDGAILSCGGINSTSTNINVEAGSYIKLWTAQ